MGALLAGKKTVTAIIYDMPPDRSASVGEVSQKVKAFERMPRGEDTHG